MNRLLMRVARFVSTENSLVMVLILMVCAAMGSALGVLGLLTVGVYLL